MFGDHANLSREFRSLVTAIRAPLEGELADPDALSAVRRERLKVLQRNVARLFELVNTLFDKVELSQLENQRRAEPEPMALAQTLVIPTLRDAARGPHSEPQRPSSSARTCSPKDLADAHHETAVFKPSVPQHLRAPLRAVDELSQVLLREHAHALDRDGQNVVAQIQTNVQHILFTLDDGRS